MSNNNGSTTKQEPPAKPFSEVGVKWFARMKLVNNLGFSRTYEPRLPLFPSDILDPLRQILAWIVGNTYCLPHILIRVSSVALDPSSLISTMDPASFFWRNYQIPRQDLVQNQVLLQSSDIPQILCSQSRIPIPLLTTQAKALKTSTP